MTNMSSKKIDIQLYSYWHAGSGAGHGADLDAVVLKTKEGLPYLPGKTLKGLLRDGCETAEVTGRFRNWPKNTNERFTDLLFGLESEEGDPTGSDSGLLEFQNAVLPELERQWLLSGGRDCLAALYDPFSSTELEKGVAVTSSLRTTELTVPLKLETFIEWWPLKARDVEVEKVLETSFVFVRALGTHRNRGLGRCEITFPKKVNTP